MKKIDIVGFGIGGINNVTLNTNIIISNADIIYALVSSEEFKHYMGVLNREVIDLTNFYKAGSSSTEVYNNIVYKILSDYNDDLWSNAVFIVEGNPQIYNTPVSLLRDQLTIKGIDFVIHPAISSLDTMIIDLNLNIAEGIQILDAGRALAWKQQINPFLDCLLLQISACSINYFIKFYEQTAQVFAPLSEYLLKYYKENHPAFIIRSAISESDKFLKLESSIGGFPNLANKIDYNCSLFIPRWFE